MLVYAVVILFASMLFVAVQDPIEHFIGSKWAATIAIGLLANISYLLYWVLFIVEATPALCETI